MSKQFYVEVGTTQNSARKDEHEIFIQRLKKGGYEIESQEKNEETGLNQELISSSLETIMKPSRTELPLIKLEAKEVFGFYDYEEQVFEKLESPKFEFSAYKKGFGLHNANDEWDKFDLG